jgi:hypothetical protein
MLNLTLLAPTTIESVLDGIESDADALDRLVREKGAVVGVLTGIPDQGHGPNQ